MFYLSKHSWVKFRQKDTGQSLWFIVFTMPVQVKASLFKACLPATSSVEESWECPPQAFLSASEINSEFTFQCLAQCLEHSGASKTICCKGEEMDVILFPFFLEGQWPLVLHIVYRDYPLLFWMTFSPLMSLVFYCSFCPQQYIGILIQGAAYNDCYNPFLVSTDGSESFTYKYYLDISSQMQFFPYV